jgi:hypothetical protein
MKKLISETLEPIIFASCNSTLLLAYLQEFILQKQNIDCLLQSHATSTLVSGEVFNFRELILVHRLMTSIRFKLRRTHFSITFIISIIISRSLLFFFNYGLAIFNSVTPADLSKHSSCSPLHTDKDKVVKRSHYTKISMLHCFSCFFSFLT